MLTRHNTVSNPTPHSSPKQQHTQEAAKHTPHDSTSDTGSSAGNYIDPFALLEIHSNVSDTITKVNTLEALVAGNNTKTDDEVFGID